MVYAARIRPSCRHSIPNRSFQISQWKEKYCPRSKVQCYPSPWQLRSVVRPRPPSSIMRATSQTRHLAWLDVTFTTDMSFNDVSAQLGAGGTHEGWRYATGDEFNTLVSHYTGEPISGYTKVYQEVDKIDGLVSRLGYAQCQMARRSGGQPRPVFSRRRRPGIRFLTRPAA